MIDQENQHGLSRRHFISKVIPACSLVCLGANSKLWGISPGLEKAIQETKHKFDQEFPQKLTYRQAVNLSLGREHIPFLKALSKEIGKDKVMQILKRRAADRGAEIGALMAKQYKGNDFPTLKKIFSQDNPVFMASLTFDITENTDTVFELKVKECIWADVFLKADAGDLGFAAVCFGDYAMAAGFNPKLKMVRDKTLMQGHSYCNHRYILG